jgi:hypothetical protein
MEKMDCPGEGSRHSPDKVASYDMSQLVRDYRAKLLLGPTSSICR